MRYSIRTLSIRWLLLLGVVGLLVGLPICTTACQESAASEVVVETPVTSTTSHVYVVDTSDSIKNKTLAVMKKLLASYAESYVKEGDTVIVAPFSDGMHTPIPIRISSERDLAEVIDVIESLKLSKPAPGTPVYTNFRRTIEELHEYLRVHSADGRRVNVLVLSDGRSYPPPGMSDVDFTAFSPTILQARRGLKVAYIGEGDLELDRLLRKPRKLKRDPAATKLVPDLSRFIQPDVHADAAPASVSRPSFWPLGDSEQQARVEVPLRLDPTVERTVALSSIEVLRKGRALPIHGQPQVVRFDEKGEGTIELVVPLLDGGTQSAEIVVTFAHSVHPLVVSAPVTLTGSSWWEAHWQTVWVAGGVLLFVLLVPLGLRGLRRRGLIYITDMPGRVKSLPVGGSRPIPLGTDLEVPPAHVKRTAARRFEVRIRGNDGDDIRLDGKPVQGEVPYRLGQTISIDCLDFTGTVTLRETAKPRVRRGRSRIARRGFDDLFGDDPLGTGGLS